MPLILKKTSLLSFILLTLVTFLPSCTPQQAKPQRSQLELREMQTRGYPHKYSKSAIKAVINALLDENFIIKNADRELGFISATKELDVSDSNERFWAVLAEGRHARYKKSSVVDASVNITEFGDEIKIRAIFQVKITDNFGMPISITQVEDPSHYQEFFSKVDKSLFYEKERI